MLILTRRAGQTVMIGDNITVTVLEAGKGRTRLGINAPREVSVQREELCKHEPPDTDNVHAEDETNESPHAPAVTN